jgi:Phage capsid scaffolding protein (GPO) serine peptidase
MAKPSKFFRVAVEGATVDGRTIDRQWIADMAAQYSPNTYGARINIEHIRSYSPDSTFKAYGDVTELKAEEVEINGVKKLALFAKIDATPELVAMVKAKQKIYTSCEITPKFADTGKAYLTGLAVCDGPASLGTEMLAFSVAQGDKSPLAGRKQSPGNHFSEATEAAIEFEAEAPEGPTLLAKVKDMLGLSAKKTDANIEDVRQATELLAASTAKAVDEAAAAKADAKAAADKFATLEAAHKATADALAALTAKLDTTPAGTPPAGSQNHGARPPATGGTGAVLTDC